MSGSFPNCAACSHDHGLHAFTPDGAAAPLCMAPDCECEGYEGPAAITISLPADVARLVYDEVQGRMESLDWETTIEDREAQRGVDDIHNRVYRALEATLAALDAAGSGPSPLGTYRQPYQ